MNYRQRSKQPELHVHGRNNPSQDMKAKESLRLNTMVFMQYVKHNRRCVSRIRIDFCAEVSLLSPAAKFCNNCHISFQWREKKTNFTLSCHPIVIWCLSDVLLSKRLLKMFLVFPLFPFKSAPPIPRSKEKPSNILKPPAMRKNWQQKSGQVFSPWFQRTTPQNNDNYNDNENDDNRGNNNNKKNARTMPMTSKNADRL